MSTVIDELALVLRLDSSDFANDYAVASKKVTEAAGKLTRENRMAKIKMDIDMSRFDVADNSVSALGTKITHLNGILANQKNIVALTAKAHEEAAKKYDANSTAAKRLEERLLREQKVQADLEKQVRQTQKARDSISSAKWTAAGAAAGRVADAAALAMAGLATISVKAAADAVESESLFETSFGGMAGTAREWSTNLRQELGLNEYALRKQAGTFYTMFESMGLGTEKSYELSTGLTRLASDMSSFYNLSPEVAFEKLRSGITGETEPLKQLGIMLDETTVKNKAWAAGIANQGAELTEQEKALARYLVILAQTSKAQGDLGRTAESPLNQLRRLRAETEQLQIELGMKLLPALVEIVGSVRNVVDAYNQLSQGSKDLTFELAKLGMELYGANKLLVKVGALIEAPVPLWAKFALGIGVATAELSNFIKKQDEATDAAASKKLLGVSPSKDIAKVLYNNETGTYQKEVLAFPDPEGGPVKQMVDLQGDELMDYLKSVQDQAERTQFALNKGINPNVDINKDIENGRLLTQKQREDAEKKAQIQSKETADITKKLTEETSKLTHTAIENEIADIKRRAQEYKDKKVDEVTIAKWATAAEAEAWEKFGNEVTAQLDSVFKSGLQNRLDGIERERQAWIKKGADEVQATKWAEEQKRQAMQDAAVQAITQNRDYLEMIRGFMKNGFASYETTSPGGTKVYQTIKNLDDLKAKILEMERLKKGIKSSDDFTADNFMMYEDIMKWVGGNLAPGLSSAGRSSGAAFLDERGIIDFKIDATSGAQIEKVKEQVGTLAERFAVVGQDASTRFFQPFHEQLTTLVGGIDSAANQAAANRAAAQSPQGRGVVNNNNITVQIDRPQVNDERDISQLADRVADVIAPAIARAVGSDSYSY